MYAQRTDFLTVDLVMTMDILNIYHETKREGYQEFPWLFASLRLVNKSIFALSAVYIALCKLVTFLYYTHKTLKRVDNVISEIICQIKAAFTSGAANIYSVNLFITKSEIELLNWWYCRDWNSCTHFKYLPTTQHVKIQLKPVLAVVIFPHDGMNWKFSFGRASTRMNAHRIQPPRV